MFNIKKGIVISLEALCLLTDFISTKVFRRLSEHRFANISSELDEKWGTGVWKDGRLF